MGNEKSGRQSSFHCAWQDWVSAGLSVVSCRPCRPPALCRVSAANSPSSLPSIRRMFLIRLPVRPLLHNSRADPVSTTWAELPATRSTFNPTPCLQSSVPRRQCRFWPAQQQQQHLPLRLARRHRRRQWPVLVLTLRPAVPCVPHR